MLGKHLLTTLFIIAILGLTFLASSSVYLSDPQNFGIYFKKQFLFLILGLLLLILSTFIFKKGSYLKLKKIDLILASIGVGLVLLVFIPGIGKTINGSARWIQPFSFFPAIQPIEILRLFLIIYTASILDKIQNREIYQEEEKKFHLASMIFIIVLSLILLISQPDLSGAVITFAILMSIIFANINVFNKKIVFSILFIGIFSFAFILASDKFSYKYQRIKAYLNPYEDSSGIGLQTIRSLTAIESGGAFGIGIANENITKYIPEPITDSIFAVIAERMGFFGVFIITTLFLWLITIIFIIGIKSKTYFGRSICIATAVWIASYFFINVWSSSRMIPVTGVPLPFISYGGTSLLTFLISIGIVYNISKDSIKKIKRI